MSERDETLARAARLRTMIEACERIGRDPNEPEERRALAFAWLDRLLGNDLLTGYPHISSHLRSPDPTGRHTHGLGHALHDDIQLEEGRW